jgi:large subunit ribosomal protein L3
MLQVLAKKIGMTHSFQDNGKITPITLIKIMDNRVIEVNYHKEGEKLIKIAFNEVKNIKKVNKSLSGFFIKKSLPIYNSIKNSIISNGIDVVNDQPIDLETIFSNYKKIDISGIAKGKGFAGVMKRWNFRGLEATHGVSVSHRSHGSTGQRQDPGKTFKGKKMAGHLGCNKITVKNVSVINFDKQDHLLAVKGSIPGNNGSDILIKICQ